MVEADLGIEFDFRECSGRSAMGIWTVSSQVAFDVIRGGQGEIYLHPDPIDLEIADFRFEFERWVKNNTSSSDPQINNNSTGEVAP